MLLKIAAEMKPDIKADMQWNPKLKTKRKEYGATTFPVEGIPLIDLNPELPICYAVEILAHELAHVIAGQEAGHGGEWEMVFDEINKRYNELMSKPRP